MALVRVEGKRAINNIKARQVDNRSQADLLVFITDLRGISYSKEHVWTYIESEGEADLRIFWDKSGAKCLKVCFVDEIAVAGWTNKNHPLYEDLL